MEISHVLRAEEWLSSAPRHMRLYEAFGWDPPLFAHLPIILAPDRSKLSKRHGATAVTEYREMGYLPEALLNFLTLLGWSLDDRTEIFSHDDLKRHFTIERVGKSGAVFDAGKLEWMNGSYIRESTAERLVEALLDFWKRYPPAEIPVLPDAARLLKVVPLIQVRIKTLRDAAPLIAFLFRERVECDAADLVQRGMDAEGTRSSLEAAHAGLAELSTFDCETIEGLLRSMARHLNVKAGQLFGSLRVATTGQKVAPPLFESIEVLGRERTLASIRHAIGQLETPSCRA
jgi:glutamyl-tRNA synthetase